MAGRDQIMTRPPVTSHDDSIYFELNVRSLGLTDDQFFRLCSDNPELNFELSAERELIIMSPSRPKTSWRNAKITQRLANWTERDGAGVCFDSCAVFTLPNEAMRSPDGSWFPRSHWDRLSAKEQEEFHHICPDFVIELRSRSDKLVRLQKKMVEYIQNGARLGWLLDPYERCAHIYRPSVPPECIENPEQISGDPVLPGFRFNFREIL